MSKRVQICSIAPREFFIKRSYNWSGMRIPACGPTVPYTSIWLTDAVDEKIVHTSYKHEEAEHIPVTIPVEQIIADFFGAEQLRENGCFIPAGAEPTQAELKQARATRKAYLQGLVQQGDNAYARDPKAISEIPGEWKAAALELNAAKGRGWVFAAPEEVSDCPVCGETLKQGVALCKSCGAILDAEKAKKYGLVGEAEKPKRGRPAKKHEPEAVAAT
jgi:hypothetical protein